MTIVYLGIGSNLGNSLEIIEIAYKKIDSLLGTITQKSSIYETVPINPQHIEIQPNYFNSVISIKTKILPEDLLIEIHQIEKSLGRNRETEQRWGPRIIDIDILYYGDLKYKSKTLQIPHPEIENRDFVLIPLEEIKTGKNRTSKNIITKINNL